MVDTTPKTFNTLVYTIVSHIPCGYVLSYGDIAVLCGNTHASRAVGYAMAACPPEIPAHRVVFKDGTLSKAFFVKGKNRQYSLLRAEKVRFTKDKKVNMAKHRWESTRTQ